MRALSSLTERGGGGGARRPHNTRDSKGALAVGKRGPGGAPTTQTAGRGEACPTHPHPHTPHSHNTRMPHPTPHTHPTHPTPHTIHHTPHTPARTLSTQRPRGGSRCLARGPGPEALGSWSRPTCSQWRGGPAGRPEPRQRRGRRPKTATPGSTGTWECVCVRDALREAGGIPGLGGRVAQVNDPQGVRGGGGDACRPEEGRRWERACAV